MEIWLANANWLCGYKSRLSVAMTEADFYPSPPPPSHPDSLNIRLDVKYLKINLLSSLDQALGIDLLKGRACLGWFCTRVSRQGLPQRSWLLVCQGCQGCPAAGGRQWRVRRWLSAVGGWDVSPRRPRFPGERCSWRPASLSCQC